MANTKITSDNLDTNIDIAGTLDVTGATTMAGFTSSVASTITTADNTDTLSLISTDSDANSGPNLRMYRNSGSPADGDNIGQIDFEGRNDNSEDVVYASMLGRVRDNTDGTEDGGIQLDVMKDGSLTGLWKYFSNGTTSEFSINDDSIDMDFRVESDGNTHMLFVDGGNDRVGIGTSGPASALHISGGDNTAAKLTITNTANTNTYSIHAQNNAQSLNFQEDGTNVMSLATGAKLGIGSSPTNLTDEIITITTPASGGGQGIAFKRLDSNNDQSVGQIRFSNNSTDDLAFIKVKTDGAVTSSAMQFFTNTGSASTERLRIDNSGSVIYKTGGGKGFTFGSSGSAADAANMFCPSSYTLAFGTNSSERMRINSVGRLLINTTAELGVNAGGGLDVSGVGGGQHIIHCRNMDTSGGANQIRFIDGSGDTCGEINSNATNNTTAYATSSDGRYKDVIGKAKGLEIINSLNPVKFTWKSSGEEDEGLIAQEVLEIVPNAVTGSEETKYMMDYSKLVTPLVKAIQEQQTIIEDLKARIEALES